MCICFKRGITGGRPNLSPGHVNPFSCTDSWGRHQIGGVRMRVAPGARAECYSYHFLSWIPVWAGLAQTYLPKCSLINPCYKISVHFRYQEAHPVPSTRQHVAAAHISFHGWDAGRLRPAYRHGDLVLQTVLRRAARHLGKLGYTCYQQSAKVQQFSQVITPVF
jgi:hypothetical protein